MDGWIHGVLLWHGWDQGWFGGEGSVWSRESRRLRSSGSCNSMSLLITGGMQRLWGEFTEWFLFSQALVWSAVN